MRRVVIRSKRLPVRANPSRLENRVAMLLSLHGITDFVREHRFSLVRRWRFDFAWPAQLVAVEIEGGQWRRGSHLRPGRYGADCDKYNAAALGGWVVLRFTTDHVLKRTRQMIDSIRQALGVKEVNHGA